MSQIKKPNRLEVQQSERRAVEIAQIAETLKLTNVLVKKFFTRPRILATDFDVRIAVLPLVNQAISVFNPEKQLSPLDMELIFDEIVNMIDNKKRNMKWDEIEKMMGDLQ